MLRLQGTENRSLENIFLTTASLATSKRAAIAKAQSMDGRIHGLMDRRNPEAMRE